MGRPETLRSVQKSVDASLVTPAYPAWDPGQPFEDEHSPFVEL